MTKKFTITQTLPSVQIWVFEVEADTAEAALQMVQDGDVDPADYWVQDDDINYSEFKVTNEEEVTDGK